jgi:hypothetical protein
MTKAYPTNGHPRNPYHKSAVSDVEMVGLDGKLLPAVAEVVVNHETGVSPDSEANPPEEAENDNAVPRPNGGTECLAGAGVEQGGAGLPPDAPTYPPAPNVSHSSDVPSSLENPRVFTEHDIDVDVMYADLETLRNVEGLLLPFRDLSLGLEDGAIPSGLIPHFDDPARYYNGYTIESFFRITESGRRYEIKEDMKDRFSALKEVTTQEESTSGIGKEFGLMSFVCDDLYLDRIFYFLERVEDVTHEVWPMMILRTNNRRILVNHRIAKLVAYLNRDDGTEGTDREFINNYMKSTDINREAVFSTKEGLCVLLRAYKSQEPSSYPMVVLQSIGHLAAGERFCCGSGYNMLGCTDFLTKDVSFQKPRAPFVILRHVRTSPDFSELMITADLLLPPPFHKEELVIPSEMYPMNPQNFYYSRYEYTYYPPDSHVLQNLQAVPLPRRANPDEMAHVSDRQLGDEHFDNSYSLERAIVSALINPCNALDFEVKDMLPLKFCMKMSDTLKAHLHNAECQLPENSIDVNRIVAATDLPSLYLKILWYARMLNRRIVVLDTSRQCRAILVQAPPPGHCIKWPILFIARDGLTEVGEGRFSHQRFCPVYSVRPPLAEVGGTAPGMVHSMGLNPLCLNPLKPHPLLDSDLSFAELKEETLSVPISVRLDIDSISLLAMRFRLIALTFFPPFDDDPRPPAKANLYVVLRPTQHDCNSRFTVQAWKNAQTGEVLGYPWKNAQTGEVLGYPSNEFTQRITCKAFAFPTLFIGDVILRCET